MPYEPRDTKSNDSISKIPFRMNFHTTSERIDDVMTYNQYLDGVPFSNTYSHCFRDLASSFNTNPIKYTPSCSVARAYESLENNRTN